MSYDEWKTATPPEYDEPGPTVLTLERPDFGWRACTSYGRAWDTLTNEERGQIRAQTDVDERFLKHVQWERV